jgi:predicted dehydrogenase
VWDQIQFVHGDATAIQSRLHVQFPQAKLRDPASNTIVKTVTSDVPDLVIAAGALPASPTTQPGAPLLVRFRRGQPAFDDEPPLVWSVTGEKGEIRLTSPAGTTLHAFAHTEAVRLEVRDFATATGEVERIEWRWEGWQEELPLVGRSIAALYEAFADGEERYATFDDALGRHEQLEGMLIAWDSQS